MNLNEFLREMRECPDELLQERLNIGDNFTILTQTSYEKLNELIKLVPSLSYQREYTGFHRFTEFFYKPGTVIVNVRNDGRLIGVGRASESSIKFHTEQGEKNPLRNIENIGIRMEGVSPSRAVALCAAEIIPFLQNNAPFFIDIYTKTRGGYSHSMVVS